MGSNTYFFKVPADIFLTSHCVIFFFYIYVNLNEEQNWNL